MSIQHFRFAMNFIVATDIAIVGITTGSRHEVHCQQNNGELLEKVFCCVREISHPGWEKKRGDFYGTCFSSVRHQ